MGRKSNKPVSRRLAILFLIVFGIILCYLLYAGVPSALHSTHISSLSSSSSDSVGGSLCEKGDQGDCCGGIKNLELWGDVVKWGADFKLNSSRECCRACRAMCDGGDDHCLCNSWVFCGDKKTCGSRSGECWLKKQQNALFPVVNDFSEGSMWTSGIVFGKEEGIIGLKTQYGNLRIKLLPECAPHSVAYIIKLLKGKHCVGCQFYRAEGRGTSWNVEGNPRSHSLVGPPFALIQGTLEAEGIEFAEIPKETCLPISRGSVAWIDSGPEFFISLANHHEWKNAYSVFGYVLAGDMNVVEKIAQLPTKGDIWSSIPVLVLETPVSLKLTEINGDISSESD